MALKPRPKNRPPRPIISEPSLLICHEKHGERYFLVQNDEYIFRVALSILKGRFSQQDSWGWYVEPGDPPKSPGFTDADIEKLPAALKADAFQKLVAYQKALSAHNVAEADWNELKAAAEGTDGRLAWQVLRANSDGEYARISLNRLSTEYEV